MQAAGNLQILADRELGVTAWRLDQIAYGRPGLTAAQANPGPQDRGMTGGGPDHPEQHPDCCRLAGAVQPQKGVDLALGDSQGKVLDGTHVAVALPQVLGLSRPGHPHSSTPRPVVLHYRRAVGPESHVTDVWESAAGERSHPRAPVVEQVAHRGRERYLRRPARRRAKLGDVGPE